MHHRAQKRTMLSNSKNLMPDVVRNSARFNIQVNEVRNPDCTRACNFHQNSDHFFCHSFDSIASYTRYGKSKLLTKMLSSPTASALAFLASLSANLRTQKLWPKFWGRTLLKLRMHFHPGICVQRRCRGSDSPFDLSLSDNAIYIPQSKQPVTNPCLLVQMFLLNG